MACLAYRLPPCGKSLPLTAYRSLSAQVWKIGRGHWSLTEKRRNREDREGLQNYKQDLKGQPHRENRGDRIEFMEIVKFVNIVKTIENHGNR